jgi:hypothetical protein
LRGGSLRSDDEAVSRALHPPFYLGDPLPHRLSAMMGDVAFASVRRGILARCFTRMVVKVLCLFE